MGFERLGAAQRCFNRFADHGDLRLDLFLHGLGLFFGNILAKGFGVVEVGQVFLRGRGNEVISIIFKRSDLLYLIAFVQRHIVIGHDIRDLIFRRIGNDDVADIEVQGRNVLAYLVLLLVRGRFELFLKLQQLLLGHGAVIHIGHGDIRVKAQYALRLHRGGVYAFFGDGRDVHVQAKLSKVGPGGGRIVRQRRDAGQQQNRRQQGRKQLLHQYCLLEMCMVSSNA